MSHFQNKNFKPDGHVKGTLSMDQAKRFLSEKPRREATTASPISKTFTGPALDSLKTAIAENRPYVVTGKHRFSLTYRGTKVFFKVDHACAPCGWLDVVALKDNTTGV